MKKRTFIILLVLMVMLLPTHANARTEQEAKDMMKQLPITEEGDKTIFNVQSIPFERIWENTCDAMTLDDVKERYADGAEYNEENLIEEKDNCQYEVVNN